MQDNSYLRGLVTNLQTMNIPLAGLATIGLSLLLQANDSNNLFLPATVLISICSPAVFISVFVFHTLVSDEDAGMLSLLFRDAAASFILPAGILLFVGLADGDAGHTWAGTIATTITVAVFFVFNKKTSKLSRGSRQVK